jgi:hypothetical protein
MIFLVHQSVRMFSLSHIQFYPMNKDEFKRFYREHIAVPAAGFGMAAVLLAVFLLIMTWLSGQVHVMQYSIDRFSQ